MQARQLSRLLKHAATEVPYYRQSLPKIDGDAQPAEIFDLLKQIPLLTRRHVQTAGQALFAEKVPAAHGKSAITSTSGSTGQPVAVRTTDMTEFFSRTLTLRDSIWHQRDFSQALAAIRFTGDAQGKPPLGTQAANWGAAVEKLIPTGPGFLLNVHSTIEEQTAWLRHVNPGYLLSYPSVLLAIGRHLTKHGWRLPNLRQVRTYGEILEPSSRIALREFFGVPVVNMYSSQEVGYIALQCPAHDHYHVQSESLLVEVLDDAGEPCSAGQVGRVVITSLHNFGMPLIRYELGDYAEVGGRCPCGRGLPVLTRILGRQRNLLTLPTGEQRWPIFTAGDRPEELPAFYQFQVVQTSLEEIETPLRPRRRAQRR